MKKRQLLSAVAVCVLGLATAEVANASASTQAANTINAVNQVLQYMESNADQTIANGALAQSYAFLTSNAMPACSASVSTGCYNSNYIAEVKQSGATGAWLDTFTVKIAGAGSSAPGFLQGKTLTFKFNTADRTDPKPSSWICTGSATDGVQGLNPAAISNAVLGTGTSGTTDLTAQYPLSGDANATSTNSGGTCSFY